MLKHLSTTNIFSIFAQNTKPMNELNINQDTIFSTDNGFVITFDTKNIQEPSFVIESSDGWRIAFNTNNTDSLVLSEGPDKKTLDYILDNVQKWLELPSEIYPVETNREFINGEFEEYFGMALDIARLNTKDDPIFPHTDWWIEVREKDKGLARLHLLNKGSDIEFTLDGTPLDTNTPQHLTDRMKRWLNTTHSTFTSYTNRYFAQFTWDGMH